MAHVHKCSFYQPNISVNTPTRIPAGRVGGIVQTNRDYIIRPECNVRSEVHFERSVAIRPAAYKFAVKPNSRVGHRSVDVQIELLAFVLWRNREVFSIPADTPPWQFAGLAGILLLERTFAAPVVWQIQLSPTAVIKVTLRIRDSFSRIPLWLNLPCVCIGHKLTAARVHPLFDLLVTQQSFAAGRIIFLESPGSVD